MQPQMGHYVYLHGADRFGDRLTIVSQGSARNGAQSQNDGSEVQLSQKGEHGNIYCDFKGSQLLTQQFHFKGFFCKNIFTRTQGSMYKDIHFSDVYANARLETAHMSSRRGWLSDLWNIRKVKHACSHKEEK